MNDIVNFFFELVVGASVALVVVVYVAWLFGTPVVQSFRWIRQFPIRLFNKVFSGVKKICAGKINGDTALKVSVAITLIVFALTALYAFVIRPIQKDQDLTDCLRRARAGRQQDNCFKRY